MNSNYCLRHLFYYSYRCPHYAFDAKMDELTQKSLRLFRAELAARYHWKSGRRRFEKNDFRWHSAEFTCEYPVVLSTTYSIKGTLSMDHIYDYLIVDEASQVDLATGVLAFSCARNVVIVGDLKQLPNVLTEGDIRTSDAIWQKYSLDERYRFSTHSYDHSFPLRFKAPKENETQVSLTQQVVIC